MNTGIIIRLGVIFVGLILGYEVIRALLTGNTYGRYKSNVYSRNEDTAAFFFWVTLRAVLALISIVGTIVVSYLNRHA